MIWESDLNAVIIMNIMAQQSCTLSQPLITDETIKEIVDCSINEDKELNEFYLNRKTHVLFVFHVPEQLTNADLFQLFARFGALYAVVMKHELTKRSRGFGFIHFPTRYLAQMAINAMDGYSIGHKRLRVTFKKKKNHENQQNQDDKFQHNSVKTQCQ